MTGNTVNRRTLLAGGIVIVLVGAVGVLGGPFGGGGGGSPSDVPENSSLSTNLTVDAVEVGAGETATTEVRVGPLPNGSAGFELTLSVGDPDVAGITNATVNDELGLMGGSPEVADDGSSVSAAGADINQNLQTDSGTVRILTVTVEGRTDGSTVLTADNPSIQDKNGNDMDVEVDPGNVTVGSG